MAEVPEAMVEEVVRQSTSIWSILGWILMIVAIIALCAYFYIRLKRTSQVPNSDRGFFALTWGKMFLLFALGGFAFLGLVSCFITDTQLPMYCGITRWLAIGPLILVDPIGDAINNDVLTILIAIVVVVAIYWTLVCCLAWCWRKFKVWRES